MKILAIDTSSKVCSISILEDKDIILEKHINNEITHSQKLMPLIDDTLKDCKLQLKDFDLFSCCIGPGSFTGVRIGVSTIKAFCDVTNIPVVGASSLESLAYNTLNSNIYDKTDIVCSLIDAKNDNVYCGIFKREFDSFTQLEPLCAKNINEIIDVLKKYKNTSILFVGDGAINYKYTILQKLSKTTFVEKELNEQTSVSVGRIAFDKYNNGIYGNSNSLTPLYLRKSQAERVLDGEE